MNRAEIIEKWRGELLNQYTQKNIDSPASPIETFFSDEMINFAIDLDLCLA